MKHTELLASEGMGIEPTERRASLDNLGFLRLPDVLKLVPIKKSTLWAWVKEGRFVAPLHLGPRTTVWRVAEVRAWLLKQAAQ